LTSPASARPTFEQFFAIRRFLASVAFAPNGRDVYYVTDTSGQFNVWQTSVDGACPRQLTTWEDNTVRSVSVSPDGETVLLTADQHGDEFHQIYALPARGGWPEAWTDALEAQHFITNGAWSPDGRSIAYAANARTPMDMEVWVMDVATREARVVLGGSRYAVPAAWSPDGMRLLAVDYATNSETTIFIVDVVSGENRPAIPHSQKAKYEPGPWAADGSGFYLLTDEGREYVGLAYVRVAAGGLEWLETPECDVDELAGSADGRVIAWLTNENGWFRMNARDVQNGKASSSARLPDGAPSILPTALTVSPDGRHAALVWQGPRHPPALYVAETESGHAAAVTQGRLAGLEEDDLARPELVRYTTFDEREVPAWLYRPTADGPLPALLAIHGGPELQERPAYEPLWQYLVSRGIAVLAPNIRGSTGYGRGYQRLVYRDWGGGDLRDLEHAAHWLLAQDWVDRERIGVWGASYGGYATLLCLARYPQLFAVGAEAVGPSNLVTLARAAPPSWRRMIDRVIGNPDDDADFLTSRSPIASVESLRAPLLVLQGALDPRVPKAESDQMVERLRELGREVEYVVFEDEGHGLTKRPNELRAFRLVAEWLERHLVPVPS